MDNKRLFPEEILFSSKEDRQKYFNKVTMKHPKFNKVTNEIIKQINNPAGFSLALVSGPSGVGKTKLCDRIISMVTDDFLTEKDIQGRLPVAKVELCAPEHGNFNWKDYYIRALEALEEPLIDKKINYLKEDKPKYYSPSDPRNSPALRRSLENALKYRRPKTFLIDEAQHLTKLSSGRKLLDQLDVIKSIANITGIRHILFGTYQLKAFINVNEQLSRRSKEIYFERYTVNNIEEIKVFKSLIYSLQKLLPLSEEPDLVDHWDFIYERTAGCIGVMKDWFMECLNEALEENLYTIDLSCLKRNALSPDKIEVMINEIILGEKAFSGQDKDLQKIRESMGLKILESKDKAVSTSYNHKPGKRNPKRDNVGRLQDE